MCLNFPPSVSILICSQVIGRESKEIIWHMKRLNDYGILWNVQMFPETPTRNTKKPSAVVTLSFAGLGFFFFFLLIFIVQAGSFETSLNKLQRSSARKILSVVPFTGFLKNSRIRNWNQLNWNFPFNILLIERFIILTSSSGKEIEVAIVYFQKMLLIAEII